MLYKIKFKKSIIKILKGIPQKDQTKIKDFILNLEVSINPLVEAKKLSGHDSLYRYRVGNYRILCDVNNEELVILIIDIAHRKEIYKGI